MTPTDPRHGTTAGYHQGCRCAGCKRALARYEKACRLDRLRGGRAVPALGAKRRLRALMVLGWSSQRIAVEAGMSHRNHVWRILHGQNGKPTKWIQRQTDAWVRDVYERLSMQIPEGHYVNRTRMYAARQGWAPPLAWDDIDNDERPHGTRESRRDLLSEWEHLRALGESMHAAAGRLGVTVKAIEKAAERARKREDDAA